MIIGSDVRLQINKIIRDGVLDDLDGKTRLQTDHPFFVLREATIDEWISCSTEMGKPPSRLHLAEAQRLFAAGKAFFYEVSMD